MRIVIVMNLKYLFLPCQKVSHLPNKETALGLGISDWCPEIIRSMTQYNPMISMQNMVKYISVSSL